MSRRAVLTLAVSFFLCGASWIDPHAKAREAARLYSSGDFSAATTKYNEALVEEPDSTLLHYNLGASAYKEGKFEDSITAYAQTPGADVADVAYNIGNAKYRLGAAAEAAEPEKALGLYAEAIAAYRRSMGADPADEDAKFNHELATRKLAELQKKLEEQKKEEEQQQAEQAEQDQKDQQDPQDQQDQQPQDEQQQQDQASNEDDQQQPEEEDSEQQQAEQAEQDQQDQQDQQQPGEPKDGEPEKQPSSAAEQQAAGAPEPAGEMTEQEAKALLDAARDQEARPEDIMRRMQPAGVREPSEDW